MLSKYKDEFFTGITFLGSGYFHILLIIFMFILWKIRFLKIFIFGFLFSYLIAALIRMFYFKVRPKKENYTGFISKIDASSFPSIHTTNSSFIAIVLSNYLNNIYATFLLIVLVFIVAYSRIYLKRHYYVDILAGMIIGISIGILLLRVILK